MKRRPEREQKGKNRSRPRGWHRGMAGAAQRERPLRAIEAAEARAQRIDVELAESRADLADHAALWAELAHVSPAVPAWH